MPMDFRNVGSQVRSLVASKKPAPNDLSRSALPPDPLRDNVIAEEAARVEHFQAAQKKIPRIEYDVTTEQPDGTEKIERKTFAWETWPEMLRDAARAGFSYPEPKTRPANEVRLSHQLNHAIAEEMLRSEGFQESRPYTRGKADASLFGALAIEKSLRESADKRLGEHIKRAEEAAEQEEAQTSAQDKIDQLREQAKQLADAGEKIPSDLSQQIKDGIAEREAAKGQLEQLAQEQAQSGMSADARAAAQEAGEAGAEAVEMYGNTPGLEPGSSANMSPDEQIALAEAWQDNPLLKRVAKMLGRLVKDMQFKRSTRTKNADLRPVGLTLGRDLAKVLPTELARAMSPSTLIRGMFIKDFAQSTLMQVDMEGEMPAGKGPIICVTDGSGSMNMGGGERLVWAISLAIALLMIALREHRTFAGIQFGGPGTFKEWQFEARKPLDAKKVLDYAGHFFNSSGTSTVTGMREALRIIEEQPEFSSADIILIGDGQDHFREEDLAIRDALRAKDVRIHGLSILCPGNVYMSQMCEWVRDVVDLAGSNDATDELAAQIS